MDRKGLVVKGRKDLMEHNLPYAHDHEPLSFVEAIDAIRPNVLIGATGVPGTFTREVIERMSALNERPAIFALSNPTSRAECTAEQAYAWSRGKAIFTSGSPFGEVVYKGRRFRPGQGNNAYVFPGVGLGAVVCRARTISDPMFLAAARALADLVGKEDLARGSLYPPLKEIRRISLAIATTVAERACASNLARRRRQGSTRKHIREFMYEP